MIDDYDWTTDGEIVLQVISKTWIPFARKYKMSVEHSSRESNKLHTVEMYKDDLLIKIIMSRSLPFELIYASNNAGCDSGGLHRTYEFFIPKDRNLVWLYRNEGLGIANPEDHRKDRWLFSMRNQIFLLEKFCSELLETGDICGWLARHQVKR